MLKHPLVALLAVLVVGFVAGWTVGRGTARRYEFHLTRYGIGYRLDRVTGKTEIVTPTRTFNAN